MDTIIRRRMLRRWRQRRVNINRRSLRDASDPLALDSELFIKSYRVTKDLFVYLCSAFSQFLGSSERCTGISTEVKILTALNYLGTGSYQKPVGRDWLAPVSQPTASRCIEEVVEALNHIFHTHVRFPTTDHEKNKIKQGLYEDHNFPGVLGCVDGTLVAILAPRNHPSEPSFFSRKGYHAINAAIICDSKLRIIGVCAKFGGAAHDSHVWRSWSVSQHLEEEHRHGKVGWLLGDSGV